MVHYEYGNASAEIVLIQMVDEHDLEWMEAEVSAIRERTEQDFRLIAILTDRWNTDLSPWKAPAVFGKEAFGGGAENALLEVQRLCTDADRNYYIGGYSLAGLFAIWAAYRTKLFRGVAAASPSIWFPGFVEFMRENSFQGGAAYLSLGDREEKTKNPVMATVGDRIREAYGLLRSSGTDCILEWNQGNHFKESELRTAKAFAWVMGR